MYAILDCHIAYLSSSWLLEVYDFLCVRFHSRHSSANRSEERFAADDSIALSFLTPRFHCMHWNCCTRRDATQTHSQRDRAISRRREPRRTSRGVDPASIVRRLANTCAHAEGWSCNYNTSCCMHPYHRSALNSSLLSCSMNFNFGFSVMIKYSQWRVVKFQACMNMPCATIASGCS